MKPGIERITSSGIDLPYMVAVKQIIHGDREERNGTTAKVRNMIVL